MSKIFIQISADGSAAVREFGKTADSADQLSDSTGRADSAMSSLGRTLARGAVIAGGVLAAGMAVAVKSAGDYESSLSQLRQASGATSQEMSGMSDLARQLGQSNDLAGVSAADAARTMVELSKAGLSVKDTMASSKAVMSLAKAGNIDFADAAVIAASALNAFGLEGKDAIQVADMLAAGANASQTDLSDLALGLQQSATVAKQFKLSLNENVTALSLFANNGIKGSDAGTSLKTMLIALAKPSQDSAALMKKIGFQAYDTSGKFVGLEEMSKRLAKATGNMTEEQKQNALATIFGTDAFRAAAVLSDNAGESYTKMSKAVGEAGAAQEAAAAQMGPYERAIEGLKNMVSDFGLAVGNEMLPYATKAADALSGMVRGASNLLPSATRAFDNMVDSVAKTGRQVGDYLAPRVSVLWAVIQTKLIPTLANAWNATKPLAAILGGALVAALGVAVDLLSITVRVVSTLAPVIMGAVAAWVAYKGVLLAANAIQAAHSALIYLTGTRYLVLNGSIIAVTGATTLATMAQSAWNAVLMMNPIGLVVGALAGLAAAFWFVTSSTDNTSNSTDRLNEARRKQEENANKARDSENQLRDAQLGVERATLNVEQATKNYNDAVERYGAESLEARQAALNMKDAYNSLEDQTWSLNGALKDQTTKLDTVNGLLNQLDGKNVKYSVSEDGSTAAWRQNGQTFFGGAFATGGFTGRGGVNEVAGTVHKGEYVLPQGLVNQSTGLPDLGKVFAEFGGRTTGSRMASAQSSSGGDVNVNITGPVYFNDRSDIDYFAEKMNKMQRLARSGMA